MTKFNIGDRIALRSHYDDEHGAPVNTVTHFGVNVGSLATVVGLPYVGAINVKWDVPCKDNNGLNWGEGWFDAVEAPERPLVHFSDEAAGRDRSKARTAASVAISKVLSDEHNALFLAAAEGESVDAYALNEAVLAAMRSATTRLGQSSGRRLMARQFAHLGHIVQAVLDNHADDLPGYEPGARSRKVETLEGEVSALRTAGADALAEVERLTEVIDERTTEYAGIIENLNREIADMHAGREPLRANLAQTIREANEFEATLAFVTQFLTPEQVNQMTGFQHGFRKGAED